MDLTWPLNVPVLSDGVVTLRAHVPTDLDGVVEMASDPDTRRWTVVPLDNDRAGSEKFIFEHIPHGWNTGEHFCWAIELEGRYAGNVDVRKPPVADIGFSLHPAARGQGVMSAAVRLANNWALTEGGAEVVHWHANIGNESSLRVAHRTGFTLHAPIPGLLNHRGVATDGWAGSIRLGDAPLPRHPWAEATVLESDRLRLRPIAERDIPGIVTTCTDPETRHWLGNLPHPYTDAVARRYLDDMTWAAATGAKVTWAVADRHTDELLGNVAVMDLLGLAGDSGEIGYWTHPAARGRGIMTEAVAMAVRHAFDPDGLDRRRLSLYAAEGNAASHAIALKNGFQPAGTQRQAETLGDGSHADLHGYDLLR